MVDRLDYKIVGLAVLFLLCWMGYSPLACRGAVVWSDDFNDGNYDGWTICDNGTLDDGDWGWSGSNWTAVNGYLQIEAGYGEAGWGIISHPSNVAYGTWSFDFKTNEVFVGYRNIANFEFIGGNFHDWDNWDDGSGYWINLATAATADPQVYDMRFLLGKGIGGETADIDRSEPVPIPGWHHIDITRTTGGLFSVYHNGALILQGEDTDIDTSEMLWLWFAYESMIDNIVVDDEILPPIDWLPIAIIGASAVVIIAVVVIILRRR